MSLRSIGFASSTPNGAPPTSGPLPHAPSSSPPSYLDAGESPRRPTFPHSYIRLTNDTPDDQYQQFKARRQTPLIPALRFDPPEEIVSLILHDLASADLNLRDVATAAHISIDSLTLWMSRPDISSRIDAFESAMARKNRIAVSNRTEAILNACTRVLDEYQHAEGHFLVEGSSYRGMILQIKNRQTALQACRIILRVGAANRPFHPKTSAPISPTPAPPAPPPKPDPFATFVPHVPTPLPSDDLLSMREARIPSPQPDEPEASNEPDAQARVASRTPPLSPAPTPLAAPTSAHKYPAGLPNNCASPPPHHSTPLPLHPSTPALPLSLPVLHTNGKSHKNGRHSPATHPP